MESPYARWANINKVVVLGAGTMGCGIAAHLANLGFSVKVLDTSRTRSVESFELARQQKPPHFYLSQTADEIKFGTLEDSFLELSEADWICEAIYEDLLTKQSLFSVIEPLVNSNALITTNTSGLEIDLVSLNNSIEFRKRFAGAHFFNPPRYLKLVELIPNSDSDEIALAEMTLFFENRVGKRVVRAKDTPGFIANRYGMWCMYHAVHTAETLGLRIEDVDAITGQFLGRPKSGSFRLNDIVGLDVMDSIAKNLVQRCRLDPFIKTLETPNSLQYLLENGWLGEKAKHGYYKRQGKEFFSLDLTGKGYRPSQISDFPSLLEFKHLPLVPRIQQTLDKGDEASEFLKQHFLPSLDYAEYLRTEISYSVEDFDNVMRWGFGWEMGPFAWRDALFNFEQKYFWPGGYFDFNASPVASEVPEQYRELRSYPILDRTETLIVRNLGEGIKSVGIATKAGVVSPLLVKEFTELLQNGLDNFIFCGEGRAFSAGFDLGFFHQQITAEDWEAIDEALVALQNLSLRLSQSYSVAALHGYALGGGLEIAIGCPVVVASAECIIGFPESKVGLLPGGGGITRMHLNSQTGAKDLTAMAMRLGRGELSANAVAAQQDRILRPTDRICFHPDRLLFEAIQALKFGSLPPVIEYELVEGPVKGMIDQAQKPLKTNGEFSDYDETVADAIKHAISEPSRMQESLNLERNKFIELCKNQLTKARIQHMLETNKPLRN